MESQVSVDNSQHHLIFASHRLALNYKKLTYVTRWVEMTDIASACKSLGIPPTTRNTLPDGTPSEYTPPALIDNTTSPPGLLSDSTSIIEYLRNAHIPRPRFLPRILRTCQLRPPRSIRISRRALWLCTCTTRRPHEIASTSVNAPKQRLGRNSKI
ncbi:hypothetical protein EV702DRAFT_1108103 [Suillus placidus]|uniref:GST N-terminal domain-containing protein n=1 Tax=Suillus placidus TaxID=48579 RepID=A0A9P6ZVN6_9AGAM|nr:hypothetical protein EV702DRAFT_1108103 [Suillus placidus]